MDAEVERLPPSGTIVWIVSRQVVEVLAFQSVSRPRAHTTLPLLSTTTSVQRTFAARLAAVGLPETEATVATNRPNFRYRSDLATSSICVTHSPFPRRSSSHNGLSTVGWISKS
jgi:hypothetical protein